MTTTKASIAYCSKEAGKRPDKIDTRAPFHNIHKSCPDLTYTIAILADDGHCRTVALEAEEKRSRPNLYKRTDSGIRRPALLDRVVSTITSKKAKLMLRDLRSSGRWGSSGSTELLIPRE